MKNKERKKRLLASLLPSAMIIGTLPGLPVVANEPSEPSLQDAPLSESTDPALEPSVPASDSVPEASLPAQIQEPQSEIPASQTTQPESVNNASSQTGLTLTNSDSGAIPSGTQEQPQESGIRENYSRQ